MASENRLNQQLNNIYPHHVHFHKIRIYQLIEIIG